MTEQSKATNQDTINLSKFDLQDLLCQITAAKEAFESIATTQYLISENKVNDTHVKSLSRLAHESCDNWADILDDMADKIEVMLNV